MELYYATIFWGYITAGFIPTLWGLLSKFISATTQKGVTVQRLLIRPQRTHLLFWCSEGFSQFLWSLLHNHDLFLQVQFVSPFSFCLPVSPTVASCACSKFFFLFLKLFLFCSILVVLFLYVYKQRAPLSALCFIVSRIKNKNKQKNKQWLWDSTCQGCVVATQNNLTAGKVHVVASLLEGAKGSQGNSWNMVKNGCEIRTFHSDAVIMML